MKSSENSFYSFFSNFIGFLWLCYRPILKLKNFYFFEGVLRLFWKIFPLKVGCIKSAVFCDSLFSIFINRINFETQLVMCTQQLTLLFMTTQNLFLSLNHQKILYKKSRLSQRLFLGLAFFNQIKVLFVQHSSFMEEYFIKKKT